MSDPPTSADEPIFAQCLDPFRGKTLEEKVQEIADRELLRDLVATYAHRMAHGLAVADLFTDDGAYINRGTPNTPTKEVRGRRALDEYFVDRRHVPERPLPMIHNNLVSIRGDEATGICSIELRLAANGTSFIASGYYQDRFRRENGRWKFLVRDAAFFHWVPLQEGWAKPA